MRSWRTTLAGIAVIIAALATAVSAQFDGDPATVPQWETVLTLAAAGVGLLWARDNNKRSEDVGA